MAVVSPFVKLFITAAASIAIIQGIVWVILGFMVVFLYAEVWAPDFDKVTYGQLLNEAIVLLYFQGDSSESALFVTPAGLLIWAIVYIIACIVWIVISVYVILELQHEKRKVLKTRCQQWSYWTTLICVMDLVLASLLARDYDYYVGRLNLHPTSILQNSLFPLAIGIMMTIVAKGFVLWILNLTFAIILQIVPIRFFERSMLPIEAT